MPARQVSQAHFDDIVKENVDEFGMDPEEAIQDALRQLESQGVDTSNLLTSADAASHPLASHTKQLVQLVEQLQLATSPAPAGRDDSQPAPTGRFSSIHSLVTSIEQLLARATSAETPENKEALLIAFNADTPAALQSLFSILLRLSKAEHKESDSTTPLFSEPLLHDSVRLTVRALIRCFVSLNFRRERLSAASLPEFAALAKSLADEFTSLSSASPMATPRLDAVTVLLVDTLNLVVICGLNNEDVRQVLVKLGFLETICSLFRCLSQTLARLSNGDELHSEAFRDSLSALALSLCSLVRCFSTDDDDRSLYCRLHDNCRDLVELGILPWVVACVNAADTLFLSQSQAAAKREDEAKRLGRLRAELTNVLSRLAVKNEICQQLLDMGVLALIDHTLAQDCAADVDIAKCVAGLIKSLCGNDNCKAAIGQSKTILPLLMGIMTVHSQAASVQETCCAALAALALRSPSNCLKIARGVGGEDVDFADTSAASGAGNFPGIATLVAALELHTKSIKVQRNACLAIRNIVSRSPQLRPPFLELGVEALIQRARAMSQECSEYGKAALRDLGCEVVLEEPWKGVKGSIANDGGSGAGKGSSDAVDAGLEIVTDVQDIVRNTL